MTGRFWHVPLAVSLAWLSFACGEALPPPTTPTSPESVVLRFEPETPAPQGPALGIFPASRVVQEPGTIALAMTAHGLENVVRIQGSVRWDPDLLEFDAWGRGAWMEQGGALVNWNYTVSDSELHVTLDRPSTLPGAFGSGEIFIFRLKLQNGVRSGTTPIQWSDPSIRDASSQVLDLNNVHGGTVTISER